MSSRSDPHQHGQLRDEIVRIVQEHPGVTSGQIISTLRSTSGYLSDESSLTGNLRGYVARGILKRGLNLSRVFCYYLPHQPMPDKVIPYFGTKPRRGGHSLIRGQVLEVIRDNPGATRELVLNKVDYDKPRDSFNVLPNYVKRGLLKEAMDSFGYKHYFLKDQEIPESEELTPPSLRADGSPGVFRGPAERERMALAARYASAHSGEMRNKIVELLEKQPGLSEREIRTILDHKGGLTTLLASYMRKGYLQRCRDPRTGLLRYYSPTASMPYPAINYTLRVGRGANIKPPNQSVIENIEGLARDFILQGGSNNLQEFVRWYKKNH